MSLGIANLLLVYFCGDISACYGSLCNTLITIVNYYLETGLSSIVH